MKAVIVIDIPKMPTNCVGCPMTVYSKSGTSVVCRETWTGDVRPDWCPLRPLPEYRHPSEYGDSIIQYFKDKGFDECLDEIMGDEK